MYQNNNVTDKNCQKTLQKPSKNISYRILIAFWAFCNRVTCKSLKKGISPNNFVTYLLILVFCGCSFSPAILPPEKNSLTVNAGQKIIVKLAAVWKDQTRWEVIDYDKELIKLDGMTRYEFADPREGNNVNNFYFTALKYGTAVISFRLQKIWGTGNYGETVRTIYIR